MISDSIRAFGTVAFNVTRPASTTYDEFGEAQGSDDPEVLTVDALPQPVTGRDLKRLPEGTKLDEVRALWALAELRPGDTVGIEGESWQVTNVEDWSTLGGYWKALCVKPTR